MASIDEIKARLKNPTPFVTIKPAERITALIAPDISSDEEDDKPIPWTMEALNGNYSQEHILETLTDDEKYTYHTKKSMKAFRNLFLIKCQVAEDEYLEK